MTQHQEGGFADPNLTQDSAELTLTNLNNEGRDSNDSNDSLLIETPTSQEESQAPPQASLLSSDLASSDIECDETLSSSESRATVSKQLGVLKGVLWGTTFTVTAVVSTLLGVVVSFTVPLAEAIAPEDDISTSVADLWRKGIRHQVVRPVNILVMGIDQTSSADQSALASSPTVEANEVHLDTHEAANMAAELKNGEGPAIDDKFLGRSDTMLLVQIDPDQNAVNVLSIPRDTQVEFPGRQGVTKINHANLVGGPRLAAKVVSHNLNGVSIDRYVRVNTATFQELVDALGGVEVVVPQPMKYTDKTQGLYIDLEEGRQLLTGEEAEQFARFRSDGNGDIGRVQRQQQLIRALRDRVMTPTIVPSLPNILQLLREHIDTNLTPEELLSLLNFALDLDRDQFRMVMLPGQFSQENEYVASYWLMDADAVDRVMTDYFDVRPKNLAAQLGISRQEATEDDLKSLRVVIQNASGDSAATQQLTRILLAEEFTRVYRSLSWSAKEAENTQSTTQIIVQRGDLKGAELVQETLDMGTIVSASIGDLHSDLTIRIGEDWLDFYDQFLESQHED